MGATTQAIAGALWDSSAPPLTGVEPNALRKGTGTQAGNTGAAVYKKGGSACTDQFGSPVPWDASGAPCVPQSGAADCVPLFAENGAATGATGKGGAGTGFAVALNGSPNAKGGGYEQGTGTGTALANPPKDVVARVVDNDDIAEQATAAIAGCRSTQLFQYADSVGDSAGQQTTAVGGRGVFKKQWLTDYNCDSGDTGGLPGYPLAPLAADGTTALAGYCTDGVSTTQALCEALAAGYCTVAGTCGAPATAAVSGECGTCDVADRFTQAECVKDADGTGGADGTWTPPPPPDAWAAATAGTAFGAACGGGGTAGVWKQRTWVPLPAGDATTAWRPVLAAQGNSAAATAVDSAAAPKTLTVA